MHARCIQSLRPCHAPRQIVQLIGERELSEVDIGFLLDMYTKQLRRTNWNGVSSDSFRAAYGVKVTGSIKMREIDPSHVKETSFACSLVIN